MNYQNHIHSTTVRQAADGNKQAQALLYKQYSKAMYNICVRMLGCNADADDVLQNIFIISFSKLYQLKNADYFASWLKKITINECIAFCKKQKILTGSLNDNLLDTMEEEQETWWHTIDFSAIHFAIKNLPNGCRQVFNLYVLEDYSHKEIASLLGITESTSKTQYKRAKLLLKQKLQYLL